MKKKTEANWDRLRTLINVGIRALCPVTIIGKVPDPENMEVGYGLYVNWHRRRYHVSKAVLVRGVRTFRNGDPGYPDTEDYVDLKSFKQHQLNALARYLVLLIAEMNVDMALENFGEEEMEQQMAAGL